PDRYSLPQFTIKNLQSLHRVLHRDYFFNIVVVQEERHELYLVNRVRDSCSLRSRARAGLSISNILQQPLGGNLSSQPLFLRQLVNLSRHGKELRALNITAFRVCDLSSRGPAVLFTAQNLRQKNGAILSDHSVPPFVCAFHRKSSVFFGLGRIGQVFVSDSELRSPAGRGRFHETKRYINVFWVIFPRLPSDESHMRSFSNPLPNYNRPRRIRATRHDVSPLVNISGIVHSFDF